MTPATATRRVTAFDLPEPQPDDRAGFGALETSRGRLPLARLEVRASVAGLASETRVRQTFVNTHDEPLEATYIFPLPDRHAVTSFRLMVAGRVVEGLLQERAAAREAYDQAIQAGHRAAIAEEDRSGVFTMRVGNLPPREEATVELSLAGPLVYAEGEATFRFPLVVAPRYVPGVALSGPSAGQGTAHDTDQVPDASRVTPPTLLPGFPNPVRLTLELDFDPAGLATPAGGWAGALKSTLHSVLTDEAHGTLRIQVLPGERLNRDFIVRFPVAQQGLQSTLRVSPERKLEGKIIPGTFALTLLPPAGHTADKPRDVAFVLDRSGSMEGWKMVAARRALGRMLDTLTERDRFAVLAFDDRLESPPSKQNSLRLTTAGNRQRWDALEWLGKVDSRGGTEMGPALEAAVKLFDERDPPAGDRERIVVVVTDGQVAGEDMLLKTLQQASGKRMPRMFALGIDRAVNAGFLQRLADLAHGTFDLVESEERLDEVLDRVHRRISAPALTGLTIEPIDGEWIGESIAPARLPDLFADTPATIYGRFLGDGQRLKLRVRGQTAAGVPWTHELTSYQLAPVTREREPATASRTDLLLNLWGRSRVRDLEDRYASGGDRQKLAAQIVQASLESGVLSRFTAFVAVDKSEMVNAGGKQHHAVQPVEQPEGWANKTLACAAPAAAMQSVMAAVPAGAVRRGGTMKQSGGGLPAKPAVFGAMPADESADMLCEFTDSEEQQRGASPPAPQQAGKARMRKASESKDAAKSEKESLNKAFKRGGEAKSDDVASYGGAPPAPGILETLGNLAKKLVEPFQAPKEQAESRREAAADSNADANRSAEADRLADTMAPISDVTLGDLRRMQERLRAGTEGDRRALLTALLAAMARHIPHVTDVSVQLAWKELEKRGQALAQAYDSGDQAALAGDLWTRLLADVDVLLAGGHLISVPPGDPSRERFWA